MAAVYTDHDVTIHQGDVLAVLPTLPAESVHSVVTSPPYYGLRDYGVDGQLGLEATPAEYVEVMRAICAQIRRVLRPDGTFWLNLGDSYAGKANGGEAFDRHRGHGHRSKEGIIPRRINNTAHAPYKSMLGMPWRLALALIDDGWILRNDIIWEKPNAMPESITDRLSSRHEHLFLFTRSPRYWFDLDAIRVERSAATLARYEYAFKTDSNEASKTNHLSTGGMMTGAHPAGRNPGDVWSIPTAPFPGAHFATFPPALPRRCILAGCPEGGTVLDPFFGSGTTGMVARQLGRKTVGIELNPTYIDIAIGRIGAPVLEFGASL